MAAEFSDIYSGAKAVRPGLDALLARCALGGIDAVCVVKLDRLGRSLINVVGLVRNLAGMGVATICTSQGIDTRESSPCGKMIMGVMAAFAEFERDIIRERTVAGLKVARANGRVLGRPSAALVGVDVPAVIALWEDECGGIGLRELARRLGGVSVSTAKKLADK